MTIFVTGFHRAGTHAYAEHLDPNYVEESQIEWDDLVKANKLIEDNEDLVIQCPALAHEVPALAERGKVYWCTRDKIDIITSMKNAGINTQAWGIVKKFKEKYPDDPMWETLTYDGASDVAFGFIRYYQLVIKVKEYFYNKYFSNLAEIVKLEDQPYYNYQSCLCSKHPLSETSLESLRVR